MLGSTIFLSWKEKNVSGIVVLTFDGNFTDQLLQRCFVEIEGTVQVSSRVTVGKYMNRHTEELSFFSNLCIRISSQLFPFSSISHAGFFLFPLTRIKLNMLI